MDEQDIKIHEDVAGLKADMKTVMTNHLPHLQAALDKLNDKVWWILGTIILGFLTTLVLR